MFGEIQKVTKSNLLKGIPWRFGPNWPGKRCDAKTRNGTRIAKGSGTVVSDINKVLKQHRKMADMMKKLSKKGLQNINPMDIGNQLGNGINKNFLK